MQRFKIGDTIRRKSSIFRGYSLTIPDNTKVTVMRYGRGELDMLIKIPYIGASNNGWSGRDLNSLENTGNYYWVNSKCYELCSLIYIGGE